MNRAERRHHRRRMLAKALRTYQLRDFGDPERMRFALRSYNHLAVCSCWMCGNPRRYLGERTIQELRTMTDRDTSGRGQNRECD